MKTRTEKDTMGPVEVPADKYWGAQTERSRGNFKVGPEGSMPKEVIRATEEEKEAQIVTLQNLHQSDPEASKAALRRLQQVAVQNGNIFDALVETVKVSSLGQITAALFEVGGQYRRNM